MAKLSDIALYLEHDNNLPEMREAQIAFGLASAPVAEIFLSFMDPVITDGRGRLNIFAETSMSRHKHYDPYPKHMGSITNYYLGGFDPQDFLSRNKQGRGNLIVDMIQQSLLSICQLNSIDHSSFVRTAKLTRDTGFKTEYEVKSLSKSTRDRKVRFSAYRKIEIDSHETWRVVIANKNDGSETRHPMTDSIRTLNARYEFRNAKVEGNIFTIMDFLDRPSFSISGNGQVVLPFIRKHPARVANDG